MDVPAALGLVKNHSVFLKLAKQKVYSSFLQFFCQKKWHITGNVLNLWK
jgi:hypothetical protein